MKNDPDEKYNDSQLFSKIKSNEECSFYVVRLLKLNNIKKKKTLSDNVCLKKEKERTRMVD